MQSIKNIKIIKKDGRFILTLAFWTAYELYIYSPFHEYRVEKKKLICILNVFWTLTSISQKLKKSFYCIVKDKNSTTHFKIIKIGEHHVWLSSCKINFLSMNDVEIESVYQAQFWYFHYYQICFWKIRISSKFPNWKNYFFSFVYIIFQVEHCSFLRTPYNWRK